MQSAPDLGPEWALMDFEVTMRGPAWLGELRKFGLADNPAAGTTVSVPITLRVGSAEHTATAKITVAGR